MVSFLVIIDDVTKDVRYDKSINDNIKGCVKNFFENNSTTILNTPKNRELMKMKLSQCLQQKKASVHNMLD